MSVEFADWQSNLRAALFNAVNESTITELAHGLVERARKGDMQATRLLFSYVIGSPNVSVKAESAMIVNQSRPGPAALLAMREPEGPRPGDPSLEAIEAERGRIKAERLEAMQENNRRNGRAVG